jgi:predicted HTH domain antitoxin
MRNFVANFSAMIIEIEVPDSVLTIPQYSRQDLLLDVAVALYQRGIYSLAKAARFAGLNRLEFQQVLAERQVPMRYDLQIDLNTLQKI